MSLITISFYEFLLFFVIISNYDVFKLNEKERMLFSSERLSDNKFPSLKPSFMVIRCQKEGVINQIVICSENACKTFGSCTPNDL